MIRKLFNAKGALPASLPELKLARDQAIDDARRYGESVSAFNDSYGCFASAGLAAILADRKAVRLGQAVQDAASLEMETL